jgi:carbon storage regulator
VLLIPLAEIRGAVPHACEAMPIWRCTIAGVRESGKPGDVDAPMSPSSSTTSTARTGAAFRPERLIPESGDDPVSVTPGNRGTWPERVRQNAASWKKGAPPMLVLSRQRDESIIIGDNIVITVVDIRGDKVRLGIQAPTEIPVHRQEVYEAIQRENGGEISAAVKPLPPRKPRVT